MANSFIDSKVDAAFAKIMAAEASQTETTTVAAEVVEDQGSDSTPPEGTSGELENPVEPGTEGETATEELVAEPATETTIPQLKPEDKVIIDGVEVTVADGLEIKANLTRITQKYAEELDVEKAKVADLESKVNEYIDWYSSRRADPADFILEILESSANLEGLLGDVIVRANDKGKLERINAMFELDVPELTKLSEDYETKARLAALEQEREAEKEAAQMTVAQQKQMEADIESIANDFANIITANELEFSTEAEVLDFQKSIIDICVETNTDNLYLAYITYNKRNGNAQAAAVAAKQAAADAEAAKLAQAEAARRAASVISVPGSSITGTAKGAAAKNPNDAVDRAWANIKAKHNL